MLKEKRKNILFIIPSLAGGGAERVLLNILQYLNRENFNLHLVLFEHKGEYLNQVPADVVIYDLKKKSRFCLFKIIFLLAYKIFPKVKPDIVVSSMEYANLIALVSKKISWIKPPVLVSKHNHVTMSLKHERMKTLKILFIKFFYSQAYKIISVSKGITEDLIKNYGILQEKIQVIYNGVDLKYIDQVVKKVDTSGIDKRISTIVACGRLTRQKNYPFLLQSFAVVQKKTKARLLILGQGEEKKSLEQLSQRLGIQDKVSFLGFQKNPFKYIVQSDVFVLSSDWEGFGCVILEAMACGVPVVSTRCPSGPDEIITDGLDGLLIPVGSVDAMSESILKLLKDEPLRKRLAEAGRKRAENFSVEKMVIEYERVFNGSC